MTGLLREPGYLPKLIQTHTPRPFIWTKTAEEILDSIARYLKRINGSGH